jgi:hypothetical protein
VGGSSVEKEKADSKRLVQVDRELWRVSKKREKARVGEKRKRKEREREQKKKRRERVGVSTHIYPPPSNVRPRTSKTRVGAPSSRYGV